MSDEGVPFPHVTIVGREWFGFVREDAACGQPVEEALWAAIEPALAYWRGQRCFCCQRVMTAKPGAVILVRADHEAAPIEETLVVCGPCGKLNGRVARIDAAIYRVAPLTRIIRSDLHGEGGHA